MSLRTLKHLLSSFLTNPITYSGFGDGKLFTHKIAEQAVLKGVNGNFNSLTSCEMFCRLLVTCANRMLGLIWTLLYS